MQRIFLLAICFVPLLVEAQIPVLLFETFDNNRYGWFEHDTPEHKVGIRNGEYVIEAPPGGWMTYVTPYMDSRKDFSFEASFKQSAGEQDAGMGFVWGHDGKELTNSFTFTSNGYYRIESSDPAGGVSGEWVQTPHVKKLGQVNKLKLENKKGTISYYLNGRLLTTSKNFKWPGKYVGFVTYGKMKLHVDDFILGHDMKINLPQFSEGAAGAKENLGPNVNSKYDEVSPKISSDGKTLYFGRKFSPQNVGGVKDKEDIWETHSSDGINWSVSSNLGSPVNTPTSNNLIAVSTDNNSLLFHVPTGFAFMHRTASGWSPLEDIGIRFNNESNFLEGCLSADGKAIVFVAKTRENAFYRPNDPERDIYVCVKDENGRWGSPIHTGKVLNSAGDEYSPFLSADGKTLYFATNGRPGYGDVDIFMSRRLGDDWASWSNPVNLGLGINTVGFDAYYTLPASGKYGYMVSNLKTIGLTDIIRFELPPSIRPDPVVLIQGRVLNSKTNKPLQAMIRFDDLSTGKEVGEARVDPKTGEYKIALPAGKNYGYHAAASGFLSVNENLEVKNLKEYSELKKDLLLVPIEIGESIQLKNVFFVQSKAQLMTESYPELDRLVKIMKDNPTIEIELSGHTDNRGAANANLQLSEQRVEAVKQYLIEKGVAAKRITGRGYGGSRPIAPSDTEENRQRNRRVEFKIVKK
jgi:outer membrane protein OmpA-like peptidoglycan-associated protein